MNRLSLEKLTYIPRELAPGVLYVSKEYAVAVHLCACGCGNKVTTPLGPAEWAFTEQGGLPTLKPSIGSWQLPCRSHYLIINGQIHWARQWSDSKIEAGRKADRLRRENYYDSLNQPRALLGRLLSWIRRIFGMH